MSDFEQRLDRLEQLIAETFLNCKFKQIQFDLNVRVCIQQLNGQFAPRPLPLENGFETVVVYKVLGVIEHSVDGELWFILKNERHEIWRISNRHLRVVGELLSVQEPVEYRGELYAGWEDVLSQRLFAICQ